MLSDVDEKHHMFPGPKRILVAEQLVFMEACFFFLKARNSLNCRPLPVALPTLQAAGPSPVLHLRNKLPFFLAKAQVDLDGSEISAFCEDVFRVAYMLDKH